MRLFTKSCLAILLVALIACALVFNTSTRYGRWLFWQDPDWGDFDRLPFRNVANDPNHIRPFTTAENDLVQSYRIDGVSLATFAEQHDSTALIVLLDDAIVLEEYFHGFDRESLQMSFSVTKSIVSMLVGIAIEQGMIESVRDPIGNYVSGLRPETSKLEIRHLLTMTSGISDANAEIFGVPAPWNDKVMGYYDPDLRGLATTFEPTNAPGRVFEYHDYNPILTAMVLESATGMSMSEFLSEKIWKPAAMQFPARWSVDSDSRAFEKPESGLNIRAVDMARIGQLMIEAGDDDAIVSKRWRDESTKPRSGEPGPQDKWIGYADRALSKGAIDGALAAYIRSIRYGYYWWVVQHQGRTDFYANGRFGQFIYICPAANLVVVRCGPSHGGLDDFEFGHLFFQLGSTILEAAKPDSL